MARGRITADEVSDLVRQMVANDVRHFSKIIDVSGSSSEMDREQVDAMAVMLWAEKGAAARPDRLRHSPRSLQEINR